MTPEGLAPLLYEAADKPLRDHGWQNRASLEQAGADVRDAWLAAAREAIARLGGGQEAGGLAAQANSAEAWREDAEELRGIIAEIRSEFKPCSPPVTSWSMEARVSEARWREWGERSGLGDDDESARAGLGDGR